MMLCPDTLNKKKKTNIKRQINTFNTAAAASETSENNVELTLFCTTCFISFENQSMIVLRFSEMYVCFYLVCLVISLQIALCFILFYFHYSFF